MSLPSSEEWRPVVGYEPYYEVSDLGRVRSLDRITGSRAGSTRRVRGHMLTPRLDRRGYPTVTFSRDGQPSTHRVHRLVAAAFIGTCPDGQEVRHLDGNRTNPEATNLAYGTRSQNMLDIDDYGVHYNVAKTRCPQGHEYTEENTYTAPGCQTKSRACRACKRDRAAARHAASRLAS